jgi:5-methylcytosine-specific restriction endonuclease McrA
MTDAIIPEVVIASIDLKFPKEDGADDAATNRQAIISHRDEIQHRCLFLGALLKDCRDKEYWKKLGYESFNAFLGDPEITLKYKTVANWILIVERYSQGLMIPGDRLSKIGVRRLQLISPVVRDDPEKWLGLAENLSKSDLTNEVRLSQGKTEVDFPPEKSIPSGANYKQYVKSCPCCVCGKSPVDPDHFPRTVAGGAGPYDVIPLCRECHNEHHDDGVVTFFERYRNKIFDWIYGNLIAWYNG